jgi:hypothetical protein
MAWSRWSQVKEKMELEEQLRTTKSMVQYLQVGQAGVRAVLYSLRTHQPQHCTSPYCRDQQQLSLCWPCR